MRDSDNDTVRGLSAGAGRQYVISAYSDGVAHPNSGGSRVELDYIDVWDGTALPTTAQEAEDVAFCQRQLV